LYSGKQSGYHETRPPKRYLKCILLKPKGERKVDRKYSRRVMKVKSPGKSERLFIVGREKEHRLLEGSQAET
jgi:hypothetical protein